MFSPPSHGEDNQNWPGDRFVNGADFNWEQERRRIFDKLSPQLKATFLRPTPGSSWKDGPKKPEDYPEKLEDDDTENKETSLTRFALLAIEPSQID
jgi:pyridoxamine 5'-phosphate oxidase